MRYPVPGTPFTRQRAANFRTAPGPWGPSVNLPTPMRSMGVPLVRSHAFPKQDRTATLRALADTRAYGFDPHAMLVPRESMQAAMQRGGPRTASGVSGMTAIARAQKRLADMQVAVLDQHTRGARLTPAAAREAFAVRVPRPSTYESDLRRSFAQRHPGSPLGQSGARQIMFDPRLSDARVVQLLRGVQARQLSQLGVRGPLLVSPEQRAAAAAARARRPVRGRI